MRSVSEPRPPHAAVDLEQLRAHLDAVRSGPWPARLEVGWLAHARLRLLAPGVGPVPNPLAPVCGVPIVESEDLEAAVWRLVDTDGQVLEEGRFTTAEVRRPATGG